MENGVRSNGRTQAILAGGLAVSVLDGANALVAYKLVYGMSPLAIYQFVASGLLGQEAFAGGARTALLGVLVHFAIAFAAAAVFVLASERLPQLRSHALAWGLGYGLVVFAVMSFVVTPLSRMPPSTPTLALLLDGVIGHALLVGLPIALAARHYLGRSAAPVLAGATA